MNMKKEQTSHNIPITRIKIMDADYSRVCPLLLDPDNYECDSVDLSDPVAKEYWLQCILGMLTSFRNQIISTQQEQDELSERRSTEFFESTKQQIIELSSEDYPKFSIRNLLELIQLSLKRFEFPDPWHEKKRQENGGALSEFQRRLGEVDEISDAEAKWTELVKGVLAGNMFDWGAKAVSDILEEDFSFGLKNAMARITDQSWIYNGLPQFLMRIQDRPYKCAAVFVDNSGCDIVLGIMPFVRQLLLQQTQVILCANSEPALNDVTCAELTDLLRECCKKCDKLAEAFAKREIIVYANGQAGPCLNMKNLNPDLCSAMVEMKTDLIVLEGMGRAIHTNLYAQFKCDTLKLAIVKNEWLARSLGGSLFSVLCKYEVCSPVF